LRSATATLSGSVQFGVARQPDSGMRGFLTHALPHRGLPAVVNRWRVRNLPRIAFQAVKVAVAVGVARRCGAMTGYGRLTLRAFANGELRDFGIASYRVVTSAGVNFIVDAFQNTTEVENFKYHGFGTGTTAESSADTALVTELTTQYATDNTRPTGTTTEGASSNIYRTVATLSPDSGGTLSITEHGVFSASSAGTLLDRSKFSVISLDTSVGDTLQATYELTFTAGS
jgi:hypothetical protein